MKFSETVAKVFDLATVIRDYWDTELPKRHPNYPLVDEGTEGPPPPPEEAELRGFLEKLPDEEIYKMLLLIHLGRWSIRIGDIAKRYEALRTRLSSREQAIWDLEQSAAEFLPDGIEELQKGGIDVDQFNLASIESNAA